MYHNLSHPQKRIWYIEKINSSSNLHNLGGCLKINGKIDLKILEQAIKKIVKNNDGLRLRVIEKDGQPYQCVTDYEREEIEMFDFSLVENSYEEFISWSEGVFKKRFNIENSPLYYFAIYKISEKECGVLLNIHHIIADGWSINLIEKQICDIYNNLINDKQFEYSCEYSYVDYMERERKYLNSDRFKKNKEFWNEKFTKLPETFLYKGGRN